jgi:hypothetical protein
LLFRGEDVYWITMLLLPYLEKAVAGEPPIKNLSDSLLKWFS